MADLTEIFTKINLQILELLKKGGLHLRDIATQVNCSPAKVHSTIRLFQGHGLVQIRSVKNRKIITLNKASPLLKEIEGIIRFNKLGKDVPIAEEKIGVFSAISPLDFRYYGRDPNLLNKLSPYLSEEGFISHLSKVEAALATVLAKKKICSETVAAEIRKACRMVSAGEVYAEEDRIKHNIRALANCIRKNVSDKAKPFVHFTATSHDIICTADALRYKNFTRDVLIPSLINLEKTLIDLATSTKDTLQIGRTHGQHAEPITFGFAIAQYVSRLGTSIVRIKAASENLRGKIAGAVGAYNASSLFFKNPVEFEKAVLAELELKASPISTQIVEAEYMADFVHSVISCFGVLANLADDMRHLQRSEIGEVGEQFGDKQVGSSTMPHKRNPINFENVKSMWKAFMPRMITVYQDQISEHQRDLTNSASSRFNTEILTALIASAERLNRTMSKLSVDEENLNKNFEMNEEMIAAEPAYILLAAKGHPDAHEYIRELTLKSQQTKRPLTKLIKEDKSLKPYLSRMTPKQKSILFNPENYTGVAAKKTIAVCSYWRKELKIR